jgi:hypothetical protein
MILEGRIQPDESKTGPLAAFPDKCPSCPFRKKGWKHVRPLLEHRALNQGTPICHSTGPGALAKGDKLRSPKPHACRGARDLQIKMFMEVGFLKEGTDEEWAQKCKEMGL